MDGNIPDHDILLYLLEDAVDPGSSQNGLFVSMAGTEIFGAAIFQTLDRFDLDIDSIGVVDAEIVQYLALFVC